MTTEEFVVDTAVRAALIAAIADKVTACYVFPEIAPQICVRLQQHLKDGEYDHISSGRILAHKLTRHMQEVNGDEHLWVKWHAEPLPEDADALRHNREWQDERRLEAKLDNFGIHKLERLPGNVGYIDLRYFHRPSWGGDTAVAAMNFLANTSALIIDLRRCPGGYPGMVGLISSYLFGTEPVHLGSMYWRDDDTTQQYWTLPYVPGSRYDDKSAYILISRDTFSGGEGFAYDLQARGRATIIGEQTDGGAHAGASYRIHPHFELFVPIGRAINPVTGRNWEKRGVIPDVAVTAAEALQTAYELALVSVIEKLGEPASAPVRELLEEARAALADVKEA